MAIQPDRAADPGWVDSEHANPGEFQIGEHVRFNQGTDGAAVLDILHGQMFRLNFVGSKILELLKQGAVESVIVDQLVREFQMDRTLAVSDVRGFLKRLEKHNLVFVRAR